MTKEDAMRGLPRECMVCGRMTGGCCTVQIVDAAWLDAQTQGTIFCVCGRILKRCAAHQERRRVVNYDHCEHWGDMVRWT